MAEQVDQIQRSDLEIIGIKMVDRIQMQIIKFDN